MRVLTVVLSALLFVACGGGGARKGPVGPPPDYEDPEQPVPAGDLDAGPGGAAPTAPPDEPPPAMPPPADAAAATG